MDFEEDVLDLKNSSETGQNFTKPVRDKFSKIVIGEDLRRAIIALRSVPKVNWSQDSNYEDNNNGHEASTEYIWKAVDLSGISSFASDWQAAVKHDDFNRGALLTNDASKKENQSEIMRKDSFTVASKRFDLTPDNKCRLVEETATSVQMSLFSREKRGKANGVEGKSSRSNPSELAASPTDIEVTRKPPPLPPKPVHLQSSKNKQLITRKLTSHGKQTLGSAEDLIKTGISLNGASRDAIDIYELSLDVLEKDDSDQELEDLTSPRSESPECLLEELLGSVPAEEFDTAECQKHPSIVNLNSRRTVKTHLVSFDNLGNRAEKLDAIEVKKKHTKGSETKLVLTSSAETESSSQINSAGHEQNNNLQFKLVDANAQSAIGQLDINAIKRNHNTPPTECSSSSSLAPEQTKISSATGASDRELTPEDIFEEIMASLETHQDDHSQTNVQLLSTRDDNRIQKHLQQELNGRSTCDYLLENEWLSIYCDQLQAEAQHETITETRISERTFDAVTNTCNSESSKSSTGKAVSQSKQISESLQSPTATLLSQDGKSKIASQDTRQAIVKRKPVPPLRDTVQTFAQKDVLIYDIKLAPATKSQPLAPRKDPKTFANDFSVSNCLNSFAELKHEPITAAHETSENRRPVDNSSAESGAVSLDGNNMKNISAGEITSTTGSLLNNDDSGSLSKDRIVAILSRESELPECDNYEEEMDLDLETELNRNLDACTASDVECQSIDKLVTSESLFPSDIKVKTRPKTSNSLQVKAPGKLGEVLAKKKLKKAQKTPSIEKTAKVVWPHRDEPVNSKQVNSQENTTVSTFGQSINSTQAASDNPCAKESLELNNFETSRKVFLGYSKDSELLNDEASLQRSSIDAENIRTIVTDSSGSDTEENYNQTIIRNVRPVEKESITGREKQQELQVMSEEVTSQEIILKIAWPKRELKNQKKVTETGKPPFRELQLKRVMRITDLDNPLNFLPTVACSQPVLAVTQQPSKALSTPQANNGGDFIPTKFKPHVDQTVAIRNSSEIALEYESQTNRRKLEHVSDSTIDVQQKDTVKVLRVPMATVHKVQDIKDAVAAVGSTILDDFKRQPKKRNIRVTCEAVESKSRASLHDEDVTVIRNTIVDTYGPKPELVVSSGPKNSVQI